MMLLLLLLAPNLDEVVRQHHATRELIQTLTCDYYQFMEDGVINSQGKYTRVGEDCLIDKQPGAFPQRGLFLRRGGELLTLWITQRPPQANRATDNRGDLYGNVMELALFDFRIEQRRFGTLQEAVRIAKAKSCQFIAGEAHLHLECDEVRLHLVLAPDRNYACVRAVTRYSSAPGRQLEIERRVLSFVEQDSIFFPEVVINEPTINGVAFPPGRIELKNVTINRPVPPLKITFPAGTVLADFIEGRAYYIDEDGNKLREHESITIAKENWANPPVAVAMPREATAAEPLDLWTLLVLGFALFLVLAVVLYWLQRRRQLA